MAGTDGDKTLDDRLTESGRSILRRAAVTEKKNIRARTILPEGADARERLLDSNDSLH